MASPFPGRIGSAPLSRLGDENALRPRPAFQPHSSGLPSRPPAGAGGPPRYAKKVPVAPPAVKEEPKPEAAPETYLQDYFPEDRIYAVAQFIRLKHCQKPIPAAITSYALQLWKVMPENMGTLAENNSLRNSLFREDNATLPSKVLTNRKLHNEVMGILGKVTDINLQAMQKELTDLPIRQSTEGEIHEVINVFFNRCTRPEDSRYTPLYVRLIAHLISTIGENEPAGRLIRREVLGQCRTTFLSAAEKAKAMEEEVAEMQPEEAELTRMQFEGKQKANICFLGLMFTSGLVVEAVVRAVLDNLLYGDGRRRRTPPDYNIVHFMNLLRTCGTKLSPEFYRDPLPRYRTALHDLSANYPQMRIRFLLQNFLETMDNNWVPLHGPDAQPRAVQEAARVVPTPTPMPEPKTKIPEVEEFWRAMDDFFTTSVVDDAVAMIETIGSPEIIVRYCSRWIGRYISTIKYNQERTRLGDLFEVLVKRGAITAEIAQEALLAHLSQSIEEELFSEQRKYFSQWAAFIRNGRSIFPPSLHTRFLDMLVEHHVSSEAILQMISDVQKAAEEPAKGEQKEYQPLDRLRVLQALLRYTPPLLDNGEREVEEDDIISSAYEADVEVEMFQALCESYDDSHADVLQCVHEAMKKSHNNVYVLISAYFTFVRYDVDTLCNAYKDVLKKITGVRPVVSLLEEVYVQWRALQCPSLYYFQFVKRLQQSFTKNDSVEKLRDRLRSEYGASNEFLASMEKFLK